MQDASVSLLSAPETKAISKALNACIQGEIKQWISEKMLPALFIDIVREATHVRVIRSLQRSQCARSQAGG